MKKLVLIGLFAGLYTSVNAQADKHFSMFAETPVSLNPAAAGMHPGAIQLFTNFRMQWLTASDNPFRTIAASAEGRFFDQGNGHLGTGVAFYNDLAGDGLYQVNEVRIPINYAISLSRTQYLSIGIQPGFYQRTLTSDNLTWESQWTGIAFNTATEANEALLNENLNVSLFDMGAGIYWFGDISKNTKITLGLSGQHLTKQDLNFFGNEDELFRKLTFHGQAEFKRQNSNLSYVPAFYTFFQGPNREFIFGSNFKYQLRGASIHTGYFDEVSLSFGAYYRVGDALMANVIFDMAGFSVGAAYDLNISGLTVATNGVGAMEFFLRYRLNFGGRSLANPRIH
ncbi:MAG: PorP/SprF family type IX secretion system membrane protein [Crocinitomicaceae bacterium]|nr:PorP/SprF family type IX secretion system membrane protein [Crocinitomicaceae bacterium]